MTIFLLLNNVDSVRVLLTYQGCLIRVKCSHRTSILNFGPYPLAHMIECCRFTQDSIAIGFEGFIHSPEFTWRINEGISLGYYIQYLLERRSYAARI